MSIDPAQIDIAAQRMATALNGTGCLQVAKMATGATEVGYLCRVTDDIRWTFVRDYFILKQKDLRHFIGTKYFANDQKSRVVYGWSINFQGEDIVATLERAASLFLTAAAAFEDMRVGGAPGVVDFSVTEAPDVIVVPLQARGDRNKPKPGSSKGAKGMSAHPGDG